MAAPGRSAGTLSAEGLWRSPVAHLVRIEGVRGSNPLSSTKMAMAIILLAHIPLI